MIYEYLKPLEMDFASAEMVLEILKKYKLESNGTIPFLSSIKLGKTSVSRLCKGSK